MSNAIRIVHMLSITGCHSCRKFGQCSLEAMCYVLNVMDTRTERHHSTVVAIIFPIHVFYTVVEHAYKSRRCYNSSGCGFLLTNRSLLMSDDQSITHQATASYRLLSSRSRSAGLLGGRPCELIRGRLCVWYKCEWCPILPTKSLATKKWMND